MNPLYENPLDLQGPCVTGTPQSAMNQFTVLPHNPCVGVSAMTGGVPGGYDHTAPMLTEDDLVNGCVMGPQGG